jgi:hypothetical protein
MAKNLLINVMAIKGRMEEVFGRGFDYTYIRKLTDKVRNEISYEIDSARTQPRLAKLRENYRLMRERLLKSSTGNPFDGALFNERVPKGSVDFEQRRLQVTPIRR